MRECLVALVEKCDLVDVAPPYDSPGITVQVAASLIIEILAAISGALVLRVVDMSISAALPFPYHGQ